MELAPSEYGLMFNIFFTSEKSFLCSILHGFGLTDQLHYPESRWPPCMCINQEQRCNNLHVLQHSDSIPTCHVILQAISARGPRVSPTHHSTWYYSFLHQSHMHELNSNIQRSVSVVTDMVSITKNKYSI